MAQAAKRASRCRSSDSEPIRLYRKRPFATHGRGPRRCSCLPARGDAGDEGVIRAGEVRMLPALAIEAQLEAQPLPAEQAQAIAQPVIAPVLGGPDAEPRRPTQPAVTPWYFVRS